MILCQRFLKALLPGLLMLTGAFLSPVRAVLAQTQIAAITLSHVAPASKEIPPLGSLMPITVALSNTTDITTPIRLIGSRDGRFIDISFPIGALNRRDQPEFSIEIPAPVAIMTYQFVIHQSDGSLTTSERFAIKRDCVEAFKVEVPKDSSTAPYQTEVATLEAKASQLKHEADSLESSVRLLEELKPMIMKE